jgi:phosphoribosylglycinamide formyltransferase-1
MTFTPVLVTEDTFHATYLVHRWHTEIGTPVALRAPAPTPELNSARAEFHAEFAGRTELTASAMADFDRLYPDSGEADRTMISLFGVPERAAEAGPDLTHLGRAINGEPAREWLSGLTDAYVHVFLDRILAPWWIRSVDGRILNAHSAILPVARGTFAVEQVAAAHDVERFARSTGATAHFVDEGVDTGPVIEARPLADPWACASIWEVKCRCFATAFDLLVESARRVRATGTAAADPVPQEGRPEWNEFKRGDFTADRQRAAEAGFLRMKHDHATRRITV